MDGRVKETILNSPNSPGVYIFKRGGKPIYVGKAKALSKRLRAYLNPDNDRMASMVEEADGLEIVPTTTEEGALMLEANLIRRYRPRYNVRLKDGNPFLYIHLTDEEYPQITIVRTPKGEGESYGPFLRRKALREFMRFARRLFSVRNCSLRLPSKKSLPPGVEYHIGRCLAPCAYDVKEEYSMAVKGLRKLLKGDSEGVRRFLYDRMMEEAQRYNYETAALWRDRLRVFQEVVGKRRERRHLWVVGSYGNDAVIVLYVLRGNEVADAHAFHVSASVEGDVGTLGEFLSMYYSGNSDLPSEVITWPKGDIGGIPNVKVREPSPDEDEVVKVASEYAYSKLESILMAKERTNPAVSSLQKLLHLPKEPRMIEGYDISHTFGEGRVASMVVFKDGKPSRSDYRRYKIKTFAGIDDYAAMYEVVKRRFRRLVEEGGEVPDLILIDGGTGQLRAALRAMREVGVEVPSVALAKRYETLILPTGEVVQLPLNDPALKLLMRVRDEAHRFALKYHRVLRSKKYSRSVLDDIPGIGKKRKSILLSHFGSVDRIRLASVQEIASLPTFNLKLAKRVKDYLAGES
jgi:excinuclease ABC subunit C